MSTQPYQCCYTNYADNTDGHVTSGWQPVCVSPGIPAEASKMCVKLQNINSAMNRLFIDEAGKVLNLFQLHSDNNFLYIMRSQYGLNDLFGRANMFSHAFVIRWDDDTLKDPNSFLTIADENFQTSVDAAREIPDQLKKQADFSIGSALKNCGLNLNTYLTLLKCVYKRLVFKEIAPLYIRYDGTAQNMRELLYCICYGLPFALRRSLSVASCETDNTREVKLIFSVNAQNKGMYIDPATGNTNYLDDRKTVRRLAGLGYLDYIVTNIGDPEIQDGFFALMAKAAYDLGATASFNEKIYKIAFLQLFGDPYQDVDNNELEKRLGDALSTGAYDNENMQSYIAALLTEVTDRRIVLTEDADKELNEWLKGTLYPVLEKAADRYFLFAFNQLSVEDAVKRLCDMSSERFAHYRARIIDDPHGQEILDCFYTNYLEMDDVDFGDLITTLQTAADVPGCVRLKQAAQKKAVELYKNSCVQLPAGKIQQAVEAYQSFAEVADMTYTGNMLAQAKNEAKKFFWQQLSWKTIGFGDASIYAPVKVETIECKLMLQYIQLPELFRMNGDEALFRALNRVFTEIGNNLTSEVAEVAYSRFCKQIEAMTQGTNSTVRWWLKPFIAPTNDVIFAKTYDLYSAFRKGDYGRIYEFYAKLMQQISTAPKYKGSDIAIAKAVRLESRRLDRQDHPIRLDVWLAAGKYLFENPFQILEGENPPFVLNLEAPTIVNKSELLKNERWRKYAKEYINAKGALARTVKAWLDYLEKNVEQNARKDSQKGKNGFSDPFVSGESDTAKRGKNKGDPRSFNVAPGGFANTEMYPDPISDEPEQRTSSGNAAGRVPEEKAAYQPGDISFAGGSYSQRTPQNTGGDHPATPFGATHAPNQNPSANPGFSGSGNNDPSASGFSGKGGGFGSGAPDPNAGRSPVSGNRAEQQNVQTYEKTEKEKRGFGRFFGKK